MTKCENENVPRIEFPCSDCVYLKEKIFKDWFSEKRAVNKERGAKTFLNSL